MFLQVKNIDIKHGSRGISACFKFHMGVSSWFPFIWYLNLTLNLPEAEVCVTVIIMSVYGESKDAPPHCHSKVQFHLESLQHQRHFNILYISSTKLVSIAYFLHNNCLNCHFFIWFFRISFHLLNIIRKHCTRTLSHERLYISMTWNAPREPNTPQHINKYSWSDRCSCKLYQRSDDNKRNIRKNNKNKDISGLF